MSQELLAQAHAYRISGDYGSALPLYQQVLADSPDLAEAWWGLAHATMNGTGDFDAAIEHFEKACSLDPTSQLYVYDLAMMHTMLGDDERAKPLFEQCLAISATSEIAGKARNQLRYYQ
jgi:tetratricopeptide (TPR) repeat protein